MKLFNDNLPFIIRTKQQALEDVKIGIFTLEDVLNAETKNHGFIKTNGHFNFFLSKFITAIPYKEIKQWVGTKGQ